MVIELKGRIPSKKNSKMMVRRGDRTFLIPSPQYTAWHQEQSYRIKKIPKPIEHCGIEIDFYAPDNRKTDLSNKAESIMDLLVDNKILLDDNWFVVKFLSLYFMGVDKENPRAIIEIRDITLQ